MKSEFLQLWDGMLSENTDNKFGIVVVGATQRRYSCLTNRNRPWDIDKAFLRRLPCTFLVDLPVCLAGNVDWQSQSQREAILRLILQNEMVDEECIRELAAITDSYSGSDLRELCKTACIYPIREMIDENKRKGKHLYEIDMNTKVRRMNVEVFKQRELQLGDFKRAMTRVQATGKAAYSYSRSNSENAFIDALLSHGVNRDQEDLEEIEDLDSDL